jgi:hypothetical protein
MFLRALSSGVERPLRMRKAAGSNPAESTKFAQSPVVEDRSPEVSGRRKKPRGFLGAKRRENPAESTKIRTIPRSGR